jgi:hypothetical protein
MPALLPHLRRARRASGRIKEPVREWRENCINFRAATLIMPHSRMKLEP